MAQHATKNGKDRKPKDAPKALTVSEMEDLKKAFKERKRPVKESDNWGFSEYVRD